MRTNLENSSLLAAVMTVGFHLGACLHVVVAMIEAGMIKTRAKDRKISNYHHRKGAAKKNTKQN